MKENLESSDNNNSSLGCDAVRSSSSNSVEQKFNQYQVYFDFTTVHGNRFVGRSGSCAVDTELTLEQVSNDYEELQGVCARFIKSTKPKWNILMLTITNIEQL